MNANAKDQMASRNQSSRENRGSAPAIGLPSSGPARSRFRGLARRLLRTVLLAAGIEAVGGILLGLLASATGADWLLRIVPGLAGGAAGGLSVLWLQRAIAAERAAKAGTAPVGR